MTEMHEQAGQDAGGRRGRPWYRKWQWWVAGTLVLVAATAGIASGLAWTSAPAPEATTTEGPTTTTSPPTTPPTTTDVATPIAEALSAEQDAKATYDNVIASFGAMQPFTTVRTAEVRHIAVLAALAERYGVIAPAGPFDGDPSPATLQGACALGVSTEQDIVTMYDELLTQVGARDVTRVFTDLQSAARDGHLPAFERCAVSATATPGSTATTSTAPASAVLADALRTAVADEQQAKATYDNVIARFGDIQPFTTVRDAEIQHIAAVEALAQRYGVTLPTGPFTGLPAPATVAEACQLGVTAEQSNVTMYALLLTQVTGYADVTQAFENLQAASRDNHLPAFERCA